MRSRTGIEEIDDGRIRHGRRGRNRLAAMIIFLLAAILLIVGGFCLGRHTQPVQRILHPLSYSDEILAAAEEYEVNPYWICAVIDTESSWDANAESSAGAIGLMQVQPQTAADLVEWGLVDGDVYSPSDLTDPKTNIEFGTAYLRYLVERYHQMQPAIAAYNAGPGTVDKWLDENSDVRDSIDYAETDSYLLKVENAKQTYESLYPEAFPSYSDAD